ncbi:MAG: gluconate 2-dehydrogenase subunit 3 family protein [bacterium]|nr:gluconate 2-dehydrogenase subunit 3 family protein [bacterium]
MDRRLVLKLAACGFLTSPGEGQQTELQFFSPAQGKMLDRLSEIIIPADERSPGAREAKVTLFIDVMVSDGGKALQRQWTAGLEAVDEEAARQHGRPFLELTSGEQESVIARMARNERRPANELERFFVRLKRMTVDGYYTSKIGIHQDLEYKGNTAISEFPGCTHAEHQA